jgi:hypothetical protein
MMIRRSFGEITLELTDEQYNKLKQPISATDIPNVRQTRRIQQPVGESIWGPSR